MKERTLLPVAVVGLLLLWVGTLSLWAVEAQMTDDDAGARVSGSETSIEWKLVTTWPKGLPGLGSAPENFARRVGEMSNGRLTVRVYGAGEVVPPFEVFDAVSQGVAEMARCLLLLERQDSLIRVLYRRSFWYDRAGNERLVALWRRA